MATLDTIQHYNGVRLRVKGSGNLRLTLLGLDDLHQQELAPVIMTPTNARPFTKLANFSQPRARLRIEVTSKDEYFEVNQINVYVRPIYTSYPQ